MGIMLKIRWDIKNGKVALFKSNQEALCKVMLDHPGVICYHVDYPSEASANGSKSMPMTTPFVLTLRMRKASRRWALSSKLAKKSPAAALAIRIRNRGRFSTASVPPITTRHRTRSPSTHARTRIRQFERALWPRQST
jgi:hypothetical protein